MTTNNLSTAEQLNNLIEFRQKVYEQILVKGRDAQFELVDALLLNDHPRSFAELSQCRAFRRRWPSLYGAIEQGQQDRTQLSRCALQQVPGQGVAVFVVDTTVWIHRSARTLSGLVYAPSPTKALKRHCIVQGHEYSLLTWSPEAGRSWSPTIFNQRLEPEDSAIEVGVAQVKQLNQARPAGQGRMNVIVVDGHYGNHLFFGPLKQQQCALLARLRRDRVLYGEAGPYSGRGRPALHGPRFAFKDPATWPTPDEQIELDHQRWGQVRLRRWNKLHARQDAQTPFAVIQAQVHLEREKPPEPLWLGYRPGPIAYPLEQVWGWFEYRWPIEPSLRFRKQSLGWTLPAFQDSDECDRWTVLVDIAYWQVFLARQLVSDQPLPWQKAQTILTPGRVLRRLGTIFAQIGSPAQPPQTRGNSPGWPKGRLRTRPQRYKVTKRAKPKLKSP